ncbi:hypothetical protein BB561_001198 [Smittium simulii]|uniref:MBOAT-domain-containing protein n=1 Tax=Smittium simulii TaxID=133385 RepID=A0A2T9YVQ4_9FUNG|nr:hypothetical protein BB561_001198 [Smittium simulii]
MQEQLPKHLEIPGITVNRISKSSPVKPPKPLVHTLEYKGYILIIFVAFSFMQIQAWKLSSETGPAFQKYQHLLSDGWLFGRKMDLSDHQWSYFRKNLLTLTIVMGCFVVYNKFIDIYIKYTANSSKINSWDFQPLYQPNGNFYSASNQINKKFLDFKIKSMGVFIISFLVILTGTSLVFILGIISINYYVLKRHAAGTKYGALIMWALNIFFLFLNETNRGYSFAKIHPLLTWMDNYRGLNRRWDTTFNITMLRIMSFDLDYHWQILQTGLLGDQAVNNLAVENNLTDKKRIEYPRNHDEYNFINYFVYLFYLPLYLTGPIITFNDFIYQTIIKSQPGFSHTFQKTKTTLIYGIRLLISFFIMEVLLHAIHSNAILKTKAFDNLSPLQISLVGYFQLTFIWLKLMLIWRFARFFALLDNYSVVENMKRCMSNNYSVQDFWRDWHCSFNRFLIRYLYIPMISQKFNQIIRLAIIFVFVALWHDLSLNLLAWAWLIVLIFIPEILAAKFIKKLKIGQNNWYYRYLVAFGGAFNMFVMFLVNLVGFALGVGGVKTISKQIFCKKGLTFIVATYILFMIHILNMYEYRLAEKRREYKNYLLKKQII